MALTENNKQYLKVAAGCTLGTLLMIPAVVLAKAASPVIGLAVGAGVGYASASYLVDKHADTVINKFKEYRYGLSRVDFRRHFRRIGVDSPVEVVPVEPAAKAVGAKRTARRRSGS